jgi:hypothetical protein
MIPSIHPWWARLILGHNNAGPSIQNPSVLTISQIWMVCGIFEVIFDLTIFSKCVPLWRLMFPMKGFTTHYYSHIFQRCCRTDLHRCSYVNFIWKPYLPNSNPLLSSTIRNSFTKPFNIWTSNTHMCNAWFPVFADYSVLIQEIQCTEDII